MRTNAQWGTLQRLTLFRSLAHQMPHANPNPTSESYHTTPWLRHTFELDFAPFTAAPWPFLWPWPWPYPWPWPWLGPCEVACVCTQASWRGTLSPASPGARPQLLHGREKMRCPGASGRSCFGCVCQHHHLSAASGPLPAHQTEPPHKEALTGPKRA